MRDEALKFTAISVAAIRADLYNTSAKGYERTFMPQDFLDDAPDSSLEARVAKLIEQGYPPPAACAMATSKQSREQRVLFMTDQGRAAAAAKKKQRRTA